MNDHSYYEELTALAAGGFLSDEECHELREHLVDCTECCQRRWEFRELVQAGLPLTRSDLLSFVDKVRFAPEAGVRERFLERARHEGIRFSPNVERGEAPRWLHLGYRVALAAVLAAVVLVAVYYRPYISRGGDSEARAQEEVDRLKRASADLAARLAERDQEVASQQKEIQSLRSQLGNAIASAEGGRRDSEQGKVRVAQSTSHTPELLDELQNRDKRLAEARDEIARINQLRATDQASLVAEQVRINEISDQLRIANATLEMERQLAAAGRDIRELMAARQLHVVDVRDTDANGKPSQAFGRVFLTEGKSLIFYAFDLNGGKIRNAKTRFQVWGEQLGNKNSARGLGLLYLDDAAQRRWALKVQDPDLLKEVNSVFVTVSPSPGGDRPGDQRLLYAYLGQANHP